MMKILDFLKRGNNLLNFYPFLVPQLPNRCDNDSRNDNDNYDSYRKKKQLR